MGGKLRAWMKRDDESVGVLINFFLCTPVVCTHHIQTSETTSLLLLPLMLLVAQPLPSCSSHHTHMYTYYETIGEKLMNMNVGRKDAFKHALTLQTSKSPLCFRSIL